MDGYVEMHEVDVQFFLPRTNAGKALAALKSLIQSRIDAKRPLRWTCIEDTKSLDSLQAALNSCRWRCLSSNDNIINLSFLGEKSGDDLEIFQAIAPFVRDGSYIEMHGDDWSVWRWVFSGGVCKEVHAEMIFTDKKPKTENCGYVLEQRDSDFFVAAENKDQAFAALKTVLKKSPDSLMELLADNDWDIFEDESGNINEISFGGEDVSTKTVSKYFKIFQATAPFVRDGSYIEMCGDDGEVYRWVFAAGTCKKVYGKLVFNF